MNLGHILKLIKNEKSNHKNELIDERITIRSRMIVNIISIIIVSSLLSILIISTMISSYNENYLQNNESDKKLVETKNR